MEPANSIAPFYGPVFGPMYFATLLATGLYGVTCMQTFFYYVHYPNDSLRLKSFVGAVWVFDTIYTALIISGVYKYIMSTLVNPLAIMDGVPELAGFVSMPTQGFFVYRIYIFGGRKIVGPVLWGIHLVFQIVAASIYVAKALYISAGGIHAVGLNALFDPFFKDIDIACLTIAAAVDVLIAIAMTYLLFKKRNIAGFERSAHILQRLAVVAVNTGIWTAIFAVSSAILLRALPEYNLLYLVFVVPLASLYCNTLLANLNARAYIRGEAFAEDMVTFSGPATSGIVSLAQSRDTKTSTPLTIQKVTEVVIYADPVDSRGIECEVA